MKNIYLSVLILFTVIMLSCGIADFNDFDTSEQTEGIRAYLDAMVTVIPLGETRDVDIFRNWDDEYMYTNTIPAYSIGKTEISWAEWNEVRLIAEQMGYTDITAGQKGSDGDVKETDNPLMPVVSILWCDIIKWCNALSEMDGKRPCFYLDASMDVIYKNGENYSLFYDATADGYRLPTESEWEYAAKRKQGYQKYPWGDNQFHSELANNSYHMLPGTEECANYPAYNDLYDMAGNVWEFILDSGNNKFGWIDYPTENQFNYYYIGDQKYHYRKGGAWDVEAEDLKINNRDGVDFACVFTGFRIAQSITYPDYPIIQGVSNNSVYNSTVTPVFSYPVNDTGITVNATLQKDSNSPIPFVSGTEITEDSTYILTVTAKRISNNLEKSISVNFTIDSQVPDQPIISGVENMQMYSVPVIPTVDSTDSNIDITATVQKDSDSPSSFTLGTGISDEGTYILIVTATSTINGLSNSTTVSFSIQYPPDPPVITGVADAQTYNMPVTPDAVSEAGYSLNATLSKNGAGPLVFTLGNSVNQEGNYTLTVTRTRDSNGLTSTIAVTFTLHLARLYFNYPDGGETISRGSVNVLWGSANIPGGVTVHIELWKGSVYCHLIGYYTDNDGSYTGTILSSVSSGTNYRMKISTTSAPLVESFSYFFTIP